MPNFAMNKSFVEQVCFSDSGSLVHEKHHIRKLNKCKEKSDSVSTSQRDRDYVSRREHEKERKCLAAEPPKHLPLR